MVKSKSQRIRDFLIEHENIPYSPYSIGKAIKIDHNAVRKALFSMLSRTYYGIRRYQHKHREETERGLYVYKDPNKNPLKKYDSLKPGLHGIQIIIRDPKIKSAKKRLDNKEIFIKQSPKSIIDRLMRADLIPDLDNRHKTVFNSVFAGRNVNITVHKRTKSIVIWLKTTDHSLNPSEFLVYVEWIKQIIGPIYKFSEPEVTQIGWNHDYFKVNIAGFTAVKVQVFIRKFQQAYNKAENFRVETHSHESMSLIHLTETLGENYEQFNSVELTTQNKQLREQVNDLILSVNNLRDENKGIVNSTSDMVGLLRTIIEPKHPGVTNPEDIRMKPPDKNDISVV